MNAETTSLVLAQLALNFDPRRFDQQSVHQAHAMWSEACEDIDDGAAMAALHDLIGRADQRFPTIGEFRMACAGAATRQRQAVEQAAATRHGMLPWGPLSDDQYGAEMADIVQEATQAALDVATSLEHDHHPRRECQRCAARPAMIEAARAKLAELIELRGLRPPAGVQTFACPVCHDLGFVPVGDRPEPLRPCDNCNQAAHQRWLDGHLMPGHQCGECDDLVRGRR
jgi:hypothetical protein